MTDQNNSTTSGAGAASWESDSTILEDIKALKHNLDSGFFSTWKSSMNQEELVRIAIQQILRIRPDLSENILTLEGKKIAETETLSLYWSLIYIFHLAAAGRPLPWEKQL